VPDAIDASGLPRPPMAEDGKRWIPRLAEKSSQQREEAAKELYNLGGWLSHHVLTAWSDCPEFAALLLRDKIGSISNAVRDTVGIAVLPETFKRIREANSSPRLAEVPPDQDALEFELHFTMQMPEGRGTIEAPIRLDILTTNQPGGDGAIAKFLAKFGEGIQQVEYEVSDVDLATKILAERFGQKAIYPATRSGANGTRVNFFLPPAEASKRILIELVEPTK
jgi:hypothetical protein